MTSDFVHSKLSSITKVSVLGGTGVVPEPVIDNLLLRQRTSENNSLNSFRVVQQGDFLYYYDIAQKGIVKMKSDGSERKILTTGSAWYLNVIGDWIYYLNDNKTNILKTKIDGSSTLVVPVKLPSSYTNFILYFTIYNNRLYFIYANSLYTANLVRWK